MNAIEKEIKLEEIAEIKTGYTFKTALSEYQNGNTIILQAGDISNNDWSKCNKIKLDNIENHSLKDGDVLLSVRGSFVVKVFRKIKNPVVASSSVLIIRLKNKTFNPEYLKIYLESKDGQKQIETLSSGSIKSISKKNLSQIKIPIVSNKKQQEIIQINQRFNKYIELIETKQELIQKIGQKIINDKIKEK